MGGLDCACPKNDGYLCFCVGYRKLNAAAIRDSYRLSRMDECVNSSGEATVFPTLHASLGYKKIEINECDCDETAVHPIITSAGSPEFRLV